MPIKDVCSPNSSGKQPKPQPLPGPNKSRNVKHAAVYSDASVMTKFSRRHWTFSRPRGVRDGAEIPARA